MSPTKASMHVITLNQLKSLCVYNCFQKTQHADALNGCIVTDIQSDDPDTIAKAQSPLAPSLKDVILKKRAAIKRQMKRTKAKYIEEQRFLHRRMSRKSKRIIKDFPDIGKTIEEFVKSCNVGADTWHRTGILTFDGKEMSSKKSLMKE